MWLSSWRAEIEPVVGTVYFAFVFLHWRDGGDKYVKCAVRLLVSAVAASGLTLLSSCAVGILSTPVKPTLASQSAGSSTGVEGAPRGLLYFLPMRNVLVTVTVATNKDAGHTETAVAEPGSVLPDLQHAYVANIPRNPAGTNDATIQINDKGLLDNETKTETTSSLTEVLKAGAGLFGTLKFDSMLDSKLIVPKVADCPDGTYKKEFSVPFSGGPDAEICGFSVKVERISSAESTALPKGSADADKTAKGLFYRINVPYKVTLSKASTNTIRTFLVFSPSESPTYVLPLASSTFGTNKSSFQFSNGVPTKYQQTVSGEIQAILSAPASVVGAYFSAVGAMFDSRKGASEKEAGYLNQINAAAIAHARNDACAAVAKSTTDLTAIKAACSP